MTSEMYEQGVERKEVIGINSNFEISYREYHEDKEVGEVTRDLKAKGLEVFLDGMKVGREDINVSY